VCRALRTVCRASSPYGRISWASTSRRECSCSAPMSSAELVTLSGCSTGLNVVVGGDELVGLMRGLLYAGAQGILVSLWDVHDCSTAEFMTAFYQRLQQKASEAEAPRAAMTELRESYPHPYRWAPFILVGNYGN
jgi:CHAT domain-containing protein